MHVQYLSNLEMHCICWDSYITVVDAPWTALTQSFSAMQRALMEQKMKKRQMQSG